MRLTLVLLSALAGGLAITTTHHAKPSPAATCPECGPIPLCSPDNPHCPEEVQ